MNTLTEYRDDGPIVRGLARLVRAAAGPSVGRTCGAPVVILLAAAVLAAVPMIGTVSMLTSMLAGFVIIVGVAAGAVPASRWAWLVPAAVRAVEFAGIIRISQLYAEPVEVSTGAFLVVIALHYYDIVYRQRTCAEAPAPWVRAAGGGWEVRLLLICLASLTTGLPAVLAILAAAWGVLFLVEVTIFWAGRSVAPAR